MARTLTSFPSDATIVFTGLKGRADLNGQQGQVMLYIADRERYNVKPAGSSEVIAVKPANIKLLHWANETQATAAPTKPTNQSEPAEKPPPAQKRAEAPREAPDRSPLKPQAPNNKVPRCLSTNPYGSLAFTLSHLRPEGLGLWLW